MSKNENAISLASILGSLFGKSMPGMTIIQPRDGQSLQEAIEEAEAEHRKVCTGCAEDFAAEQRAAKADGDALIFKAKTVSKLDASNEPAGAQTEGIGHDPFHPPVRKPVGYMLRTTMKGETKYIAGSFDTDRERAERKLAMFNQIMPVEQLNEVAEMLGKEKIVLEIASVYAD
jgi:hypothetical protein